MEELPLPYDERQLREFTDLLIELSLPGYLNLDISEPVESEEDDGPLQPWAGFIQDAAIQLSTFFSLLRSA